MEAEQAMQEYISCVNVLDPEGSTKVNCTICQPLSHITQEVAAFSSKIWESATPDNMLTNCP